MTDLEKALDEFRSEMLAKFLLRAPRQGNRSVHLDGNLDRMDPESVERHYRAEQLERALARTPGERAAEDVDVANMAFLDWYAQRRLERGSPLGAESTSEISRDG